jgi:iron complex outermembrane recepter protein
MLYQFRGLIRAAVSDRRWPAVLALLVGLLGAAPVTGGAQARTGAIIGRVLDAESGAALPFVIVRVVEAHRVEQTHGDGAFQLRDLPPATYTLIAQRIGYQPVERRVVVTAGADSVLTLQMRPVPVTLAPTVVTGSVRERRAIDAVSPTTVLDGAELDRRLEGTLAGTLASQPGVSVTSMGPATARPVLRGMSGDRVLVLEDGTRTGDLSTTSADHAVALDALTVRRVEVVRGPNALLYGSSALGGVINAVREEVPRSRPDAVHGTVSTQAASVQDALSVGGELTAPLGAWALRAEGSARTAGDLRTPERRLPNTPVQAFGASVGLSRVGDAGYVGVAYRGYGTEYGLPGDFVGAHPGGVDITMQRHALRLEADRHREGRFNAVRGSLVLTDYAHEERTKSGRVSTRFEQRMLAAELLGSHGALGGLTSGSVGARLQVRDLVTAGALRTPSTGDWSLGAFVVEELVRGDWTWQAGLRGDLARFTPRERTVVTVLGERIPTDPRTFANLSGSLGTVWRAAEGLRLGASLSRSFRTPDVNELYSDGPHLAAYSYDVGNPRLDAETGVGLDLFARLERERVRAELALFTNRFAGYIFPRNTGELGRVGERWKFQYTGRDVAMQGGELSWTWLPHPALVVEGDVAYVRGAVLGARDTIPGLDGAPDVLSSRALPLLPPVNGRLGLRWDRPRWFAGVGGRAAAAQERLGDFETRTAGYAVADAHVGLRLLLGDRLHAITLRVDNAFDRAFRDHLSRTKEIIPEAGRNVALLYRILF